MTKKKLQLSHLELESFSTSMDNVELTTINGGRVISFACEDAIPMGSFGRCIRPIASVDVCPIPKVVTGAGGTTTAGAGGVGAAAVAAAQTAATVVIGAAVGYGIHYVGLNPFNSHVVCWAGDIAGQLWNPLEK